MRRGVFLLCSMLVVTGAFVACTSLSGLATPSSDGGAEASSEDGGASEGVYWTTTGEIRMCPVAGCPKTGPITLAQGQVSPDSIVLDATAVYWANNAKPGQIMRVAK